MYRLVIGYGNPLRCDDGVGWRVADQLTASVTGDAVRISAAHQLAPEMAEAVSGASEVLFLDAVAAGEPGTWSAAGVAPSGEENLSALVHHLTPAALIALAQALYGAAPRGRIVTVVGEDFGYGETLSAAVEAALPDVRRYIVDFLRDGTDACE